LQDASFADAVSNASNRRLAEQRFFTVEAGFAVNVFLITGSGYSMRLRLPFSDRISNEGRSRSHSILCVLNIVSMHLTAVWNARSQYHTCWFTRESRGGHFCLRPCKLSSRQKGTSYWNTCLNNIIHHIDDRKNNWRKLKTSNAK